MSKVDYRDKCLSNVVNECNVCGSDTNLVVHHINGNRSNNKLDNLIPLCKECHSKVHTKKKQGNKIDKLSKNLPDESKTDTGPVKGGGHTTIPIDSDVRDRLRGEKQGSETYSEVIERLLNNGETA